MFGLIAKSGRGVDGFGVSLETSACQTREVARWLEHSLNRQEGDE